MEHARARVLPCVDSGCDLLNRLSAEKWARHGGRALPVFLAPLGGQTAVKGAVEEGL